MTRSLKTWVIGTLLVSSATFCWFCNAKFSLSYEVRNQDFLFEPTTFNDSNRDEFERLGLTKKTAVNIKDLRTGESKKIHGRFLHVTDFHPDPYYKEGSKTSRLCHGGQGEAGKYGDAILGCDSPLILVEQTIDWISKNLKDEIDFIVWTGDNIRHDNDREFPRFESDIFSMNEKIASLMRKNFGDLPIPTIGNNDVYPHNLFAVGPTFQTREFYKLWKPFIPHDQMRIFNQGVYYFEEVVPSLLAVLSINTLYLFQSNPLVDSCDKKKDPGYKLFLWLGYTLKELRKRNMKVWLTGHVPPNAKNYDISCLRKYILWSHEYRDVIIGGLYGHMNIDHFIPLDSVQAYKSMEKKFRRLDQLTKNAGTYAQDHDDSSNQTNQTLEGMYDLFNSSIFNDAAEETLGFEISFRKNIRIEGGIPMNKVEFMNTVRTSMYSTIEKKKKSGDSGERYSIAHVSPSVVPTFNPSVRVWEYNITDLYDLHSASQQNWDDFFSLLELVLEDENLDSFSYEEDILELLNDKGTNVRAKKDKTIPPKMPEGVSSGPAYSPQLFTPERYVQYYLDLKAVNEGRKDFDYEIEYTTDKDYNMKDLTVQEWLKFGRILGKPLDDAAESRDETYKASGNKAAQSWKTFLKHSFVSSDYENLGYG